MASSRNRVHNPWQHGEAEPWRFSKNPTVTRQWRQSDLNRPSRWQGNQNRPLTRLGPIFCCQAQAHGMGHEPGADSRRTAEG